MLLSRMPRLSDGMVTPSFPWRSRTFRARLARPAAACRRNKIPPSGRAIADLPSSTSNPAAPMKLVTMSLRKIGLWARRPAGQSPSVSPAVMSR